MSSNKFKRKEYSLEKLNSIRDNLLKAYSISKSGEVLQTPNNKNSVYYNELRIDILKIAKGDISEGTLLKIFYCKKNRIFNIGTIALIEKYIETLLPSSIDSSSQNMYTLEMKEALPRVVLWGPDYGKPAGIFINNINGEFVAWNKLKIELENQVLKGCPRIVPIESKVQLVSFYGKENHIIRAFDISGNEVCDVWMGGNPEKNFEKDGLVRIGKTHSDTSWTVYQVYTRYSDGSYRLFKSYL